MRMNVVSKTRAHAGHAQMIECFVRSGSGIPRKFTQFRVVTSKHGGGAGRILAKKEGSKQEKQITLDTGIRSKRYRESVNGQGQEDLDTNQGGAGRKTGREGLPTQGRVRRECSHHA